MGEGVGWGERGWGREGVSAPAPDSLPACFFDSLLTGYRLVQTALDIICLSVSFCYDKIGKLNLKNMNRRRKLLKKLCAASAGSITRQFGADSLRRNVSFRISLRCPIHIINPWPVDKTKLSNGKTCNDGISTSARIT